MLDTTLKTAFLPGTNLKGDVTGANWSFALPSLEIDQIVCIGVPPVTTLKTLSRLGRRVFVICSNSRHLKNAGETIRVHGLNNVRHVLAAKCNDPDLPDGSTDLVVIVDRRSVRRLGKNSHLQAKCRRVLKPNGLIYCEFRGPERLLFGRRARKRLLSTFGGVVSYWLTPLAGEMHTAVPLADDKTITHFLDLGLQSATVTLETGLRLLRSLDRPASKVKRQKARVGWALPTTILRKYTQLVGTAHPTQLLPFLKSIARRVGGAVLAVSNRIEGVLNRYRALGNLFGRTGLLIGHPAAMLAHGPPQYLKSIAACEGINIGSHRWGLAAGGEYSSRKLLFLLFDRDNHFPEAPEYIVKMTRDAEFNARLERESRALWLLHERGIGDRETLPQVVFSGSHGGLAIVGETAIDGVPFDRRTVFTAGCPYARDAIDWLIELGAATADPLTATPDQVAEGLAQLFGRFVEIYDLTPAHHTFLANQIEAVARSWQPLPLVFQHGDPGRWNVLVTSTGRAAFLDWESAEPEGMPLWDLFYFLRSYCVGVARSRGTGNALDGFVERFLNDSSLSRLAVEVVTRYCERTGVPTHLVEPLFYTCWMHRALKESARLVPARLQNGHYVSLLRTCIDHRDSLTLERLFSLPSLVEL